MPHVIACHHIIQFSKNFLKEFNSFKTKQNFFSQHSLSFIFFLHRKEVIHPHVLVGMPCYDFTPVTDPTLTGPLLKGQATDFRYYRLPWRDGRCVPHPGTYSPRHSDSRLLAIPTSCSRVADYNPNWDVIFEICSPSQVCFPLFTPLQHVCSPSHKGHDDLTSSPPSSGLHRQYLQSSQLNVSN